MNMLKNIDLINNDNIKLAACILHLHAASRLIDNYNSSIALTLLELVNAIITEYNVDSKQIELIDNLKTKILDNTNVK